ncbi:hypothetical protein AMAG_18297 [Allomyces macrogynus ATCC 38327]|uniref:DFDF domain-containing protein n=1 Tax=Allomyces macrogynus (strain ATCC 38327) TaxID=578462 RepID=A0A0L0S898_ALLM3|nr:hypothetical protein AMAG_18297 [Allomyces macrogynus ATCC 38327]|eukprot:KNE58717.1 hypothetical protein AMAG_18297 [Allomyces macrogynus ATCC 38327]
MSLDQYRGVTITLISHLDIRYEGTLDDINPETQPISLSNVRSFGTEGRKGGNPVEEIPPQEMVFPYICFRASDVKDLAVKEEMTAPAPPPPAPVLNDPAIIEYSTAPVQPQQQQQQYQAPTAGSVRSASTNRDDSTAHAQSRSPSPSAGRQPHHQHHYGGHHHQSNHRRGGHRTGSGRARQPRGPVEIPKEAFDFEGANAKLNKDDLVKEFAKLGFNQNGEGSDSDSDGDDDDLLADEAQPAPQKLAIPPRQEFYDKKTSFFDNISCEARTRQEALARGGLDPQQRRARMHEERKLNVETFGTATPASRVGRGGSRGRGGYRRNDDGGRRYDNDGGQPRWGGGGGGGGRRTGGSSGYGMDQAQYGARGDGGNRRGWRARGEADAGDV